MNFEKITLCFGLMLVGAACWISAERFHVVPPMCLITEEIYQEAAAPTPRRK